jgi:hypothetical protein
VFEKLAILLIGWLLGLLAPVITDQIRSRRENELGRQALLSELGELGNTLALAAFGVRADQGSLDRKFIEWLKSDMERFSISTELQGVTLSLRHFVAMTDVELVQLNAASSQKPNKATILQRYAAPLLDSRVNALWSFETTFQRKLLEIKHHMALLDDLVDRSRKYFDLTFTKLEGDNHRLVAENLKQACNEYGRRAELLVGKIRML